MIDPKVIIDIIQTVPLLAKIIRIVKREGKPLISIKHLVVKSDLVIREILEGRFRTLYEEFHAKRVYLHENEVSAWLREIHRDHVARNYYDSWEETPVSDIRDKNSNIFEKNVTIQEIVNLSKKYDPEITGKIIENKAVDPNRFCKVAYFFEGCEGGSVNEMIEFRPMWFVLLWIENLSDNPVDISQYTGKMYFPNNGLEYRELTHREGENYTRNLPFNVVEKGASILVPEYVVLAPIKPYLIERRKVIKCDKTGQGFDFVYTFTNIQSRNEFHLIGPSLNIRKIKLGKRIENVHEFDVENTLTLSEVFEMGSCPYVIGYKNAKFYYIKDILSTGHEKINVQSYQSIIIAEIEDEITFLGKIIIGNEVSQKTILLNRTLNKGDFFVINNLKEDNKNLILHGNYFPKKHNLENKYILVYKYQNLMRFLSELATWSGGPPVVAGTDLDGFSPTLHMGTP